MKRSQVLSSSLFVFLTVFFGCEQAETSSFYTGSHRE